MLPEKVAQLKDGATKALAVAEWWETQIAAQGVDRATAFYKHIGLNHLELKSIEWEGLTLSREPTDIEKLCVKSISQAQESGRASVTKILLQARAVLIDDALKAVKKLTPATYHKLILAVPDQQISELRDQLGKVFIKGKRLVDAELGGQKLSSGKSTVIEYLRIKQFDSTEEDDAELDDLTDLTGSRISNEMQARIASAASRFVLAGLTGKALWDAVAKEVGDGSTGWLDRIATGTANKVLNFGRQQEAEDRANDIEKIEYSCVLDANSCDACASADGETTTDIHGGDLEPVPNISCAGFDACRCFWVYIAQ